MPSIQLSCPLLFPADKPRSAGRGSGVEEAQIFECERHLQVRTFCACVSWAHKGSAGRDSALG